MDAEFPAPKTQLFATPHRGARGAAASGTGGRPTVAPWCTRRGSASGTGGRLATAGLVVIGGGSVWSAREAASVWCAFAHATPRSNNQKGQRAAQEADGA